MDRTEAFVGRMTDKVGLSDDQMKDILDAWLVQKTVDRHGHCNMNNAEVMGAFADLVAWVENGVVPPSGDVTIP